MGTQTDAKVTEVFFEVAPFIDANRAERFAIMRTEYWVRDGHTISSEAIDVADSRADANALLGHYKVMEAAG